MTRICLQAGDRDPQFSQERNPCRKHNANVPHKSLAAELAMKQTCMCSQGQENPSSLLDVVIHHHSTRKINLGKHVNPLIELMAFITM